jgi:type VII secretion-associated serine protease mycosin
MRAGKLGGLAAVGALGLAVLTGTPSLAAPKPKVSPSRSAGKPTPTKTTSPTPPPPAVECNPPQAVAALHTEPWAQQRLDFTRVWNLTRGNGVTVAVVDSGVDATQPQLAGHVSSVDITHTMTRDCIGHGTAVAGIIAAQDRRSHDLPFVGVAPGVHLVSVKFTNQNHTDGADPNLPRAIREAAGLNAKVINVSVTAPDTSALRSAVRYAQTHDAVVVAAAGNVTDQDKGTVGPAYPAAYPDVIGVGSLSPDGTVADSSNTVTKVSVSAPGKQVATTWPGGYAPNEEGTSFAAAFVSGTAALVRARHPNLNYKQVKSRLEVTADGSVGAGSGAGMINPVQAVNALLPGEDTGSGATTTGGARAIRVAYRHPTDRQTRSTALVVTGIALGGSALAVAGGVFIPMGRRRGWRPGRTTPTEGPDA